MNACLSRACAAHDGQSRGRVDPMCMACEEMQLYYAYLDAVEEEKRKAQPWQCEVTVIAPADEPAGGRRARPPPPKAAAAAAKSGFVCDDAGMNELTALTIAERARRPEAEEILRRRTRRRASCRDRAGARAQRLCAGDAGARARHGQGLRRAHRQGRGRSARRHSARDQGHVLHRGRAHHRLLAHPRQFRADLRVDGDRAALARRRGAARQDQQRRVRHGLVERDLVHRAR